MVKKLLIGRRDFAKELRVQKALARQIESERKLRKLQAENRQKFQKLHPHAKSRILRGLKTIGLGAAKEFKEFRAAPKGKRVRTFLKKKLEKEIEF